MRIRLLIVALIAVLSLFSIDAMAAVGRTPGQFNVSQSGSAQYAIPIWAPPGPRGIQPQISLSYDSESSKGPLGIGWSLGGLGQITRCPKTVAQDTTAAPVALVVGDGYCLNGARLRLTSGTYGVTGSTYQTEIADFSIVTAYGTAGNGPQYFKVQARNGVIYYFGYTDAYGNGAHSEVLANGTSTALTWLLSKVIDPAGNNLVINYTALTGTAVPNQILWTPTSAGASTYSYTMQFNYGTNVPQSSINEYVAGTLVSNTELLTSIEILAGSTVVKDYFLGYQASPLTAREELISVKECADSGGSSCLSPTSISYESGTPGLSSTSNTAVSTSGALLTTRYDLNGDGYPDLIYNPTGNGDWYVSFGSAGGYGVPVNTGITGFALFGNLTGGTEDGILADIGGYWWYYTWNGTGFTGKNTNIAFDASTYGYQLADINGDGLPDLIDLDVVYNSQSKKSTATVYTRLNTSAGGTASFSSTVNTAYTAWPVASAQLQTPDTQYGKVRRYDFNGDHLDDLVLLTITGTAPNFSENTYELLSSGTTFTGALIASASGSSYVPVYFTDWNDDKCTDFVTANTLYVSGCNGTAPVTYPITGTVLQALDWDGDGRTDLLVVDGSKLGVYLSKATGSPTLTATSIPYTSTCAYVWMDANGDGLDDLGCWSQTGSNPISYYLHNGTSDLATEFADGYGNSASPTYVPISENNYTEHYNGDATYPDADYIGPIYVVSQVNFSDPSSAPGGTYNQTFWYYGAWVNLQGRGFDGFGATRMLDSRNNLYDYRLYERSFPYTGMEYQDILSNATFYPLESTGTTSLTTLSTTTNEERYFPYFSNWTVKQVEVGGTENSDLITTTSINYTYDNYGNALTVDTTVTDNDPGSPYEGYTWSTNVTNTPDVDGANQSADIAAGCLNLIDESQVVFSSSLPGSTSVPRTQTFTPDSNRDYCRIDTIVTEPTTNGSLYEVTESFTFDAFGNIATDTITGNNMPASPASRVTTNNWGTTGQFLNYRIDPSNAKTVWTYNSSQSLTFGVPDSVKNANNATTSWVYDAFGRKTKETRPDGTATTWAWTACTSYCGWSNSVYQVAQSTYQTNGTTLIRTDTAFYDPIDRITESSGPTLTGALAVIRSSYNSLGLLYQRSMPFISGGTVYDETRSYDVLNRLTQVSRPINSGNMNTQSTTYAYAGRKRTITDALGHARSTITDVNGWLRRTTDALGYTVTRAFDSAGSVIGVTDSVGNTLLSNVTYAYGIKPFLVSATDADLGSWSYTIDSLGERTGWTDAKGQSFAMTYDALSRPVSRTEPDLYTVWEYGTAAPNFGNLTNECTQAASTTNPCTSGSWLYNEVRGYDSIGRLQTRSITQNGNPGNDTGGAYTYTFAYSATTGFLNTLTYPISTSGVALNLQYGYAYGLLQTVTDTTDATGTCGTSCTLWSAGAMDAFGHVTQETLGNGIVTNRTYDGVTSWLSAATAGIGGGAAVLNQSYLQDEDGNVLQRQDNNRGLTENLDYDADNRLTCATLSSNCSTNTFQYDNGSAGPGNITSQVGVGTYNYNAPGGSIPHAVRSITGSFLGVTNPSFSYDANGNMTARASTTANITWWSSNYPSSISGTDVTGNEEVQFNYGPDRQRWEQIYTGPGGIETTYYLGDEMEVVFNGATSYRHYIYAGSKPIAVYSRSGSTNTMSYILDDHQGSVAAITASTGATDIGESFTAFGQRREYTTWSGAPTPTELLEIASLTRQGYTFQTALGQSLGLNHMNGRVQDGILARFLSPDPHITDQSDAQNYNRFSYVLNNPVTFRDPTGFDDCTDDGNGNISCTVTGSRGGGGFTDGGGGAAAGALGNNPDRGGGRPGQTMLSAIAIVGHPSPSAVQVTMGSSSQAQSPGGSSNDPSLFNPQTATNQTLQEITVTGSISTPPSLLPLTPSFDFPSFGTTGYGGFTPRIAPNNFVRAAGALVATTTTAGAVLGATYAYLELPGALAEFASWGGEVALLGSAGAFSDIGAMGMTGAMLGAEGGILVLPAFGAGYAVGSYISPWVNQNIIDPYVYPMLGLPRY